VETDATAEETVDIVFTACEEAIASSQLESGEVERLISRASGRLGIGDWEEDDTEMGRRGELKSVSRYLELSTFSTLGVKLCSGVDSADG
jgi:hypothetical protein